MNLGNQKSDFEHRKGNILKMGLRQEQPEPVRSSLTYWNCTNLLLALGLHHLTLLLHLLLHLLHAAIQLITLILGEHRIHFCLHQG